MKSSTSVKYIRKAVKILKIGSNNLKIEAKKEDYTIINIKDIISLFQVFYIYIEILVFLAILSNKLQL